MLLGRVTAALQGVLWLGLVFSVIGLAFAPMAWFAAAIARRDPRTAVLLLLAPVAFLGVTWVPWFVPGSNPVWSAIAIVAVFTVPAVLASALIWAGRATSGRTSAPIPTK